MVSFEKPLGPRSRSGPGRDLGSAVGRQRFKSQAFSLCDKGCSSKTAQIRRVATCVCPFSQVHTTGMDITHTPNASAVVTLGKDMTFRDYSQGAFRMRGILRGQKVKLFVIPEVAKLIQRELAAAKYPKSSVEGNVAVLREVVAWLVINSMRSERIQFNQLCIQVLSAGGWPFVLVTHASIPVLPLCIPGSMHPCPHASHAPLPAYVPVAGAD